MASLLYQTIEQISREKHIEPEIIVAAIEDAMVVAARKYYRTEEELRSKFNPDTGQIDVYSVHIVVEEVADPLREISLADARKQVPSVEVGSEITHNKPTDVLGRIAAQTAKQVILQKVREAERDTIYNEFHTRVGELINSIVKRTEGPDLIVDLGRTEARLPKREQSRLESYNVGDRLRVTIRAVERAAKGPQVIVSRGDPALVQRLFEMEVPEIYDGTVQIRAVARESGERTKIAVESRDKDVDPVGACVGMKGMRVQSIIRELRGEKIDIIEFNDDPVVFATHALSPAKISRVSIISPADKHMEVIVDDTQLSLAIGKKGQNVRLAAKLLGWRIDIKSEEEKRQEVESQMAALVVPGAPVAVLLDHGLAEDVVEKLMAAEVSTVERLGSMTPEELDAIGIGADMVEQIQLSVNGYYGQFESPAEETAEASADSVEHAILSPAAASASVDSVEQAISSPAADGSSEAEASSETSGEASHATTAEVNASETSGEKSETENESVTIKNTEGSGER